MAIEKLWAIVMPGELLARRLDKGYAKAHEGIQKMKIWGYMAMLEFPFVFILGIFSSSFSLIWVISLALFAWVIAGLADLHLWRRIYGHWAKDETYKSSFLVNLDMIYWFALGWIVGVLI